MARPQIDPLRNLSTQERTQLEKISRSLSLPATRVIRAKELLAVADGVSWPIEFVPIPGFNLMNHLWGAGIGFIVAVISLGVVFNLAGLFAPE